MVAQTLAATVLNPDVQTFIGTSDGMMMSVRAFQLPLASPSTAAGDTGSTSSASDGSTTSADSTSASVSDRASASGGSSGGSASADGPGPGGVTVQLTLADSSTGGYYWMYQLTLSGPSLRVRVQSCRPTRSHSHSDTASAIVTCGVSVYGDWQVT
jgi:hypothetical protein